MKFYRFKDDLTNEESYFSTVKRAKDARPKVEVAGFSWMKDREMEEMGIEMWCYCRDRDVNTHIARIKEETIIE